MKKCENCGSEIRWQNNELSKILNEEYPHDFSICDIDGCCRHNKNNNKKRIIIYESKNINEKLTYTQKETLIELKKMIKWEMLDNSSGVYIIKLLEKPLKKQSPIQLYIFDDNDNIKLLSNCFIDDFYKLISRKINIEDLIG